eukprot:scaffold578_cov167-Amphora_coffeaeformis.AAC.32
MATIPEDAISTKLTIHGGMLSKHNNAIAVHHPCCPPCHRILEFSNECKCMREDQSALEGTRVEEDSLLYTT